MEALVAAGEKVGLLKVRLFRPFPVETFVAAIPASVKSIAVLDRTKEPGATGEPLYCDVITALAEMGVSKKVIGGRYGLASKEFTPAMVKGVFDELLKKSPKNHFTVGIQDDVTHTSLDYDPEFSTEVPGTVRALFYGLGADGTVGANKNSIKIIGEETDNFAQGYFVYDSKKSGAMTTSHLRFGPKPLHSSYLITKASFVACHQFSFLERFDVLKAAEPGATFLLNSTFGPDEVWDHLPRQVQRQIIDKKLKFYVIDGYEVAKKTGMGGRVNTIMQTCFFAISGVLPREEAIEAIKHSIEKTYGKRGESVVKKNFAAVDAALDHLHEVKVPGKITALFDIRPAVPAAAPEFVQKVTARIIAGEGDDLPVSAMPIDGTFPTATAQWEKRNIALEIPEWDQDLCIQCGKCVLVCPHSVIRAKVYDDSYLGGAPATFKAVPARWKDMKERKYTLQVAPEDCTGCTLCVQVCPAKSKSEVKHRAINMVAQPPLREAEAANWDFFLKIPETDRKILSLGQVKDVQLLQPLFEFSGACSGCGETPYIKLMTQLFGDRMLIANATGCSSIYGGNLPTTPYCQNEEGRGPAWSNSLFEDNAEFGLGMRLAADKQNEYARELVWKLGFAIGENLAQAILNADQKTRSRHLRAARARPANSRRSSRNWARPKPRHLLDVADALVKKSVWILGGDGWAYDIGYGGLGPRAGIRPQRQRPGARYRGLLQYRRPGVQIHAARRRRQVRGRRQTGRQEGPGHDGGKLRQRLRGARRHGVERHAHPQGLPGSRSLQRAVADHRLQPLHRPRLRPVVRHGAAEGRRQFRLLAAVPLQPRPGGAEQEPLPVGFPRARHPAQRLHLQRDPLHHAGQEQSRRGQEAVGTGPGRCQQPLEALRLHGP